MGPSSRFGSALLISFIVMSMLMATTQAGRHGGGGGDDEEFKKLVSFLTDCYRLPYNLSDVSEEERPLKELDVELCYGHARLIARDYGRTGRLLPANYIRAVKSIPEIGRNQTLVNFFLCENGASHYCHLLGRELIIDLCYELYPYLKNSTRPRSS